MNVIKNVRFWITILVVCLGLSCLQTLTLGLQESIKLAEQNNKELQQAWEEVEKYRQDYKNVRGNLLPQINFSAGYQFKKTELSDSAIPPSMYLIDMLEDGATTNDTLIAGFIDQSLEELIPRKISDEYSAYGQLKLDQVVFMGGKLINGINIAGKLYHLQEKNYFLVKQEIVFGTIDKYYLTKLAEKVADIQRDALDLAERYYHQVNDMYEQGLVSEYDKLRAQLEYLKLQPEMMEAEKKSLLAKTDFQNYLGIEEKPLLIDEIEMKEMEDFDLELALQEGLRNRIEIELSELNIDVQKVNHRYEKGNFLPNIGISAEYNYFSQSSENIEREDWGNYYQIGIGFSMPIFSGFSNTAKSAKARHNLKQAEIQHKDVLEMIELDIRNTWLQWQTDLEKVKTQKENVALAEKGLQIAQARYENQVSNQLEVFDAQLQLKSARLSYLNATYEALISYEKLKKAMGREL